MLQKNKYIRAKNSNYIIKALLKEIKHRPRLRNKFLRERINNDGLIIKKEDLAKIFYNFSNSIVKRSQAWSTMMNRIQPIQMPLLKAIAKYENCPSILKFLRIRKFRSCQEHDIPVNLIKLNKALSFDLYTTISISPCSVLIFSKTQQQMFCQHVRRKASQILRTIVHLVFFLCYSRSMKDVSMTKCISISPNV